MCIQGLEVRVHWGLDHDTVARAEVHGMFPSYERWFSVYRQANSTGMFDNAFTIRLRIFHVKEMKLVRLERLR